MAAFSSGARLLLKKGHASLLFATTAAGASSFDNSFLSSRRNLDCEAQQRPATIQQRMTAVGHFSTLSETKYNPSIITFVLSLTGDQPLSKADVVSLWKDREMMERHPRFQQTLSKERPGYFESRSSHQDMTAVIASHISETLFPAVFKKDIQSRIRHLQTTPWDLSDSGLWHMYVAPWGPLGASGILPKAPQDDDAQDYSSPSSRGESILIFRGHHALADGASMGAALLDLLDEANEFRQQIARHVQMHRKKARSLLGRLYQKWLRFVWFVTGSIQAVAYFGKCLFWEMLWDPNPWSMIKKKASAVDGAVSEETPERTVSWSGAVAPVEQVKWVAQELVGEDGTVNDVFVSCVTGALAKQLDYHRKTLLSLQDDNDSTTKPLPEQRYMHIAVPVHLKGGVVLPGESVGNNLGAFVVRLPGEACFDGEKRLVATSKELHSAKRSPAPFLSHLLAKSLSYSAHILPSSWASWLFTHASAGSVAVVTNTRGPTRHVHIGGRRVENIYGFVPLPPGLPVGVVVSSYAGDMLLTVTAEPWAVPDADRFLAWVLEEYLDLVRAAKRKSVHTN